MNQRYRNRFPIFLLLITSFASAAIAESPKEPRKQFVPDADSVARHGTAWKFPQDGWLVVHIEGTPYERGYQHGRLLAREIVDYCNTIAKIRSEESPDNAWRDLRLFTNALFLRRFDPEYLREMQGIADGAASVGARLDGRLLDLIDIVVINADIELGFLESALEGTPNGIDRETFHGRHGSPLKVLKHERCSAFLANGPATADGKIVAGHVTMSDLCNVRFFNIWLDIEPSEGHRMVFQTFPGGIQSGLDYYITSAGLIVAETTIQQTRYDQQGEMLASRIRRVVQYADNIDRCVEILTSSNNGLYTNEWLFGDLKTNEIAMFELGTRNTRLWRSSRDEWVAGTKGFYWGCNNVKDVSVLKDSVADLGAKPANLVLHPRLRDEAWLKLFQKRRGTIDEAFGFEAFSTAPLIGFPTCDAKFTTASMAAELKTWALFGPPLGRTWTPSDAEREQLSIVKPLVANDWTLIDVRDFSNQPIQKSLDPKSRAVDLDPFPKKDDALHVEFETSHPFAWRGTLLPKTDADLWLAAAFSEYEKVVALEHAVDFHDVAHFTPSRPNSDETIDEKADSQTTLSLGEVSREGKDLVDLALFQHESRWLTAIRRSGHDVPLKQTRPDPANADWYRIAAGKGVMLLAALRQEFGSEKFFRLMDSFGQAYSGQPVTTEQFRAHLVEHNGDPFALSTFDKWVAEETNSEDRVPNPWTVFSHEVEPDRVLIVYGTRHDRAAQKEAAEHLQTEIVRRFANVWPDKKADNEVTEDDLKSRYLLLIGRPETNQISARCLADGKSFPVQFGRQSFSLKGETYANPESYIIAAGTNPWNPRYSAVIFAGLNADSTWRSVRQLPGSDQPDPQIILSAHGKRIRKFRERPAQ